jgi:hypothetical protein
MGRAYNTYGIGEKCILVRKHEGKKYLENLDVDGIIILKLIFKKFYMVVGWINLAQVGGQYRAILNTP